MRRITVAITGASGAIYALRTLRALLMREVAVDVVISEFGWMLLRDEAGFEGKQQNFGGFIRELYGVSIDNLALHPLKNLAATLASGSAQSGRHGGGAVFDENTGEYRTWVIAQFD